MIERKEYLEELKRWKDKDLIKVITGIKRCGKSTILKLFIDNLKKNGVSEDHIIYLNLESLEYNFKSHMDLYSYINSKIKDNEMYYIFLDEIELINGFERSISGLYTKENLDIYITSSNNSILSGEAAVNLSGKYIEIKLLPLSFKEYVNYYNEEGDEKIYLKYINNSAFPYTLKLTSSEIDKYLENIYNAIIIKDIASRKKLKDTITLENIIKFIFSNIGNIVTTKKIAESLTYNEKNVPMHIVENYLTALLENFIFNKVSRYDIKTKQLIQGGEKYYSTDVTMRYLSLGRKSIDLSHTLENIIYLELIRRGYKVYTGKIGEKEIDFIAENNKGKIYIQVAYTLRDKKILDNVLSCLEAINDYYPKYILTMDNDPELDFNGIRKINAIDWLLDKDN